MRPLQIGIIGCGNVLEAYIPQCEKLRVRNLAEVTLGCGRKSQQQRGKAFGIPRFVTDSADVFSDPAIDIVVILTPMLEHAALGMAALKAGKHVLVEKPLATSLTDAKKLIILAREKKRHLICAPFTILSPTFQIISSRIKNGEVGKPCTARARYGWSGPWWNEWFYQSGGGSLFDLGVYSITTLTGLLGPVKQVSAMSGIAIPERKVKGKKIRVEADDNSQVLLDFGANRFAVVTSGYTMQQYRSPAIEIYGTEGTIQMLGDDWDPDGYELWQNSVGAWQLFKETDPDWSWTDGLRHLVECIHNKSKPLVQPDHAYHVLEIMLKAQLSSRSSRTIKIESSFIPPVFISKLGGSAHLLHDRSRKHLE